MTWLDYESLQKSQHFDYNRSHDWSHDLYSYFCNIQYSTVYIQTFAIYRTAMKWHKYVADHGGAKVGGGKVINVVMTLVMTKVKVMT